MAHFAKLDDNNVVLEVHVVNNDVLDINNEEQSGIDFFINWSGGYTNWKQTSYNGTIRKNYAGIGFVYDKNKDAFIAPKPYPSWVLDQDTCKWQAPISKPVEGLWSWDEELGVWVEAVAL